MKDNEELLIKIITGIIIIYLITFVFLAQTVINRNEEIHDLKIENDKLTNIIELNLIEKVEE